MANSITKTTLHPEGDDTIYLYPKTSVDQVEGLYSTIRSIGVGFHPMGDWISGTTYNINDVVTYNNSSYLCRATVTSTTPPPEDTANWQISGGVGPQGKEGPRGTQGETGATGATPNITANVEVGNTTGTPSATVERSGTNENPVLTFSFNNLKGEQGIQGETGATGATPNITANVEVNNTTGTPSATVERNGTNEAPILNFSFKNLKGEQGIQGIQGDSLNPMGAWVANNEYHPLDLVTYGVSSYYCTNHISGSSVPPDQDTTHWAISAQGGTALNGLPTGGTTGQILSKKSNANFDAEWVNSNTGKYMHNIRIEFSVQDHSISGYAEFSVPSNINTPVSSLSELKDVINEGLDAPNSSGYDYYYIPAKLCGHTGLQPIAGYIQATNAPPYNVYSTVVLYIWYVEKSQSTSNRTLSSTRADLGLTGNTITYHDKVTEIL